MDDVKLGKAVPEEKEDTMVLSRNRDGLYMLTYGVTGRVVQLDERTASKLMLWETLGEAEKSRRLASRFMGVETKAFRLDAALLAKIGAKEQQGRNNPFVLKEERGMNQEKTASENGKDVGKGDSRNKILDAHVTGIGAAGDFHLTARVQDEKSGEVREVKGMITGIDAALLRSDTNEQGKDATVLRNAQALASENFEKGMMAAITPNNAVTMKMD